MKITNITITREDITTLLTFEGGGFDYWCNIDFDNNEYSQAKQAMKDEGIKGMFSDGYCYEEVLGYMIWEGNYKVYAYDFEEDKKHRLTKANLRAGFLLNCQNHPEDCSLEDGDAYTADRILQYAVLGDVIYG